MSSSTALIIFCALSVTASTFALTTCKTTWFGKQRTTTRAAPQLKPQGIRASARLRLFSGDVQYESFFQGKQSFEVPLLYASERLTEGRVVHSMVQALPSAHLPIDLTTLSVYELELSLPIHQTLVKSAIEMQAPQPVYLGQVSYKPSCDSEEGSLSDSDWIGAIGCITQILVPPTAFVTQSVSAENVSGLNMPTQRLLCKGMNRFIVRKVKQTTPFVIAVVDILHDDNKQSEDDGEQTYISGAKLQDDEEDDEDDMFEQYDRLEPTELERRLMQALREFVQQQLMQADREMSPLERSLLPNLPNNSNSEVDNNENPEQLAARALEDVLLLLERYIIDELSFDAHGRYFALSFLAAEMANMNNEVRRKILNMTNSVERLRLVTAEMEQLVGMARARKMANSITAQSDELDRDLKVGQPELPPWAKTIRKGMVVEYFWNEELEWCTGIVVEDPLLIVDELIITVHFDDDDSIHKIPFSPDEKARWRPRSSSS